jgi:NAD(P)-dependent dehydrogenase (short-subunit alcohol dehydrogenase family)
MMAKRLAGKTVVITGGTKGIGKGIALMCADEGANVVISGRNDNEGNDIVREIKNIYGMEAMFVGGDITQEVICKHIIEETVARFGKVDGLVNNAGIFPRSSILDTMEDQFDSVFAVNIKASFFLCKYVIANMLKTGGGSIVQMGSTHAYKGAKELAAYSISKGALLTLNRHIAANYSSDQIRSNWITVGWVASEGEVELHHNEGLNKDELFKWAESIIPSGRMQTPEDIAYSTIYLLSDDASQVTGSEIAITGGLGI